MDLRFVLLWVLLGFKFRIIITTCAQVIFEKGEEVRRRRGRKEENCGIKIAWYSRKIKTNDANLQNDDPDSPSKEGIEEGGEERSLPKRKIRIHRRRKASGEEAPLYAIDCSQFVK